MTVDKSANVGGEKIEKVIKELDNNLIMGFGVNCSFGSKNLFSVVERIKKIIDKFIIFYPNAGIPNKNASYPETKNEFKKNLELILEKNKLNIVGGCCGTDYHYIRELKKIIKKI